MVLGIITPFAVVFSFYPQWQGWRHKKPAKAWLARFIASWPQREKLASIEGIPDAWQRITVGTMADTLAADREAILLQGGREPGEVPARPAADGRPYRSGHLCPGRYPGPGLADGGPAGC